MFHKRQGIECLAEQLLVSEEGLFSLTLFFINYNDIDNHNVGNLHNRYSTTSFDESVYHSCHVTRSN
jgi:hypothetical protein